MLYWIHARILYWLLSCPLYWLNCPKHVLAYVAHACALAHRVWPAAQESSPGMLSLGSPPNLGSGDNNLVQKSANCQFLHTFHFLATSFRPSPFIESIVLFPLSPFLDTHRPLPSRAANKHLALCSEAAVLSSLLMYGKRENHLSTTYCHSSDFDSFFLQVGILLLFCLE